MPTAANIAAASAMLETILVDAPSAEPSPDPHLSAAPPVGDEGSEAGSAPEAPASGEVATDPEAAPPEAEAAPAAPKTPEDIRKEKLSAQLESLRQKNAERKHAGRLAQQEAELRARAQHLAAEEQRVQQVRQRWEQVGNDPVKAFEEMGLDVGETFLQLSQAAQKAGTPDAKLEIQNRQIALLKQQLEQVAQGAAQREQAVERRAAEQQMLSTLAPEKFPFTRAYFPEDAVIVKLAHQKATAMRARGVEPTYELIASEIEYDAAEHHATVMSRLPRTTGATQSTAARAATAQPGILAPKSKAVTTLTNDLASATASSGSERRKTMRERQAEAVRMLDAREASAKR